MNTVVTVHVNNMKLKIGPSGTTISKNHGGGKIHLSLEELQDLKTIVNHYYDQETINKNPIPPTLGN